MCPHIWHFKIQTYNLIKNFHPEIFVHGSNLLSGIPNRSTLAFLQKYAGSFPYYAGIMLSSPYYAGIMPSSPYYAGIMPSSPYYAGIMPSSPYYAGIIDTGL